MSLLETVTAVADECGYNVSTSIIGSTDVTTKQLLAIANRVLGEMAELYTWNKFWKSYSFTLVSGTDSYALPGDFSQYHFNSFWNTSSRWALYGPMSPQDYASFKGQALGGLINDAFAIRGVTESEILIYPTPGAPLAGSVIAFEYQSSRYARPAIWETGQNVSIGGYTFYLGNYYKATTTGTTGGTAPVHTTGSASDGGVTWEFYDGGYKQFLADTDEPILSERIFRQGVLERFASIKNVTAPDLFYSQLAAEYGRQAQVGSFSVVASEDGAALSAYKGKASIWR